MELLKINELLDKYWAGETTREEEAQLRRYFREEDPPAELRAVAELFHYYDAPPQLNEAFDERLLGQLSAPGKSRVMWPTLLKIAAVVAIFLLGALWAKHTYLAEEVVPVATVQDTYQDPERAYEETKQALLLVSSLMNEGTQHLTKLEEFDEAQRAVEEEPTTEL